MKSVCCLLISFLIVSWSSSAVMAQAEQPRRPAEEGLRPAPGDPAHRDTVRQREEGRPREGEGQRPEGRREGEGIRPEARREGGRPGMPEMTPELIRRYMELQRPSPQAQQVEAMRSYLDV